MSSSWWLGDIIFGISLWWTAARQWEEMDVWNTHQRVCVLEASCYVEEAQHEGRQTVWFSVCGVLEGKTVGTEILSVLARGWGLRVEVGGKEHKGTFVGGRMLYILIVAAVLGLYTVVRASNCTLLNLHSIVIMLHIKIRLEFEKNLYQQFLPGLHAPLTGQGWCGVTWPLRADFSSAVASFGPVQPEVSGVGVTYL